MHTTCPPPSRSRRRLALLALALVEIFSVVAADAASVRASFGNRNYIEYLHGDLPLVITAPHGGRETPDEIPDREQGAVDIDTNTQELARVIAAEIAARTGHSAHLVICRLHRRKLDCNREIVEAAAGSPAAEKAWNEYHGCIEEALAAATARHGHAFLIDLHGQNHPARRIELGYLHDRQTFAQADTALEAPGLAAVGSMRRVAEKSRLPYSALLRGPRSFGALLEARGFPCTPSPERPMPELPYFRGGYTLRRHVAAGTAVSGFQLEANLAGLRDTAENRAKFAAAFVAALGEFLAEHLALRLPAR